MPFTGECAIELEALDSATSSQVAAYIETRVGKKYPWTDGVGEGVGSYIDAYSTWAYIKKAIEYWAQLIRERIDVAQAKAEDRQ